jgi:hypothetical protein
MFNFDNEEDATMLVETSDGGLRTAPAPSSTVLINQDGIRSLTTLRSGETLERVNAPDEDTMPRFSHAPRPNELVPCVIMLESRLWRKFSRMMYFSKKAVSARLMEYVRQDLVKWELAHPRLESEEDNE